MSAPETSLHRQATRHKPSLIGIGAVVIFGVAALAILTAILSARGESPLESTPPAPAATAPAAGN